MEAHRLAMEEQAVVDALKLMFPAREGWIILPGVEPPPDVSDSLRVWFASPRIVQPDTLDPDAWARFLTRPGEIHFEAVSGYLGSPRGFTPAGFAGLLVTFRVRGINAAALVVDGAQMRWLTWWESEQRDAVDSLAMARIDSIGSLLSHQICGDADLIPGYGYDDSALESLGFYPPIPAQELEPMELWEEALSHAKPRLEGMREEVQLTPDIITGPRIIASAPRTVLSNQEPFLLQRRLVVAQRHGWPGFNLTKNEVHLLPAGEYIWVAGPYDQVRAVGVERKPASYVTADDYGPSVLFFGRPVRGAGLLVVGGEDGRGHVSSANAFPREYGLSLYSRESLSTARRCGEELFTRIGHLLAILPGPRESEPWPAVETLPTNPPWGQWRPVAHRLRFDTDDGRDLFSEQVP